MLAWICTMQVVFTTRSVLGWQLSSGWKLASPSRRLLKRLFVGRNLNRAFAGFDSIAFHMEFSTKSQIKRPLNLLRSLICAPTRVRGMIDFGLGAIRDPSPRLSQILPRHHCSRGALV